MAFTRDLLRLECHNRCGCNNMSLEQKQNLLVMDFDLFAFHRGARDDLPRGIYFKFPVNCTLRSQKPGPDTLFELSFKVASIVTENFVRREFTMDRDIIDWHFPQFLRAKELLIRDFSFPPKFAEMLLPRLSTKSMWPIDYPSEIFINLCEDHSDNNYEVFYSLRW